MEINGYSDSFLDKDIGSYATVEMDALLPHETEIHVHAHQHTHEVNKPAHIFDHGYPVSSDYIDSNVTKEVDIGTQVS